MSKEIEETILMPKSLTAENGSKSLLIGEFHETVILQCEECNDEGFFDDDLVDVICEECDGSGDYAQEVPIKWTTIKEIYAMCVEHFESRLNK